MSQMFHFIGIGGIGMSGLARILLSKDYIVSGSDIAVNYTIDGLIKAGATVHKGHSAHYITSDMTIVYSSDIKNDNVEYLAAIKLNCRLMHRSDLLAYLIENYDSIAVAGTHGKTTTSALLATVLMDAGLDPTFAVGGILPQFQTNSRVGSGSLFPFEADESDGSFLKYFPFGAIVTNIDNDHLCSYQDKEENLIQAFKTFMSQVSSNKHLFWCFEDAHLKELAMPGKTYGFSELCDWQASNIRQKGFQMIFDIRGPDRCYEGVELSRIGHHNVLNALAVFGLAITLGVEESAIRHSFKSFQGVMRRCEFKGQMNDITFIDDYAHHPTEIQTTLKAIKSAIEGKRLVVIFQPHRYSRTKDCLGQFGSAFEGADTLFITDIYSAGETPIPNLSHENIMADIESKSSVSVRYSPRSALGHILAREIQPNDFVVSLGAGDITKVTSEIMAYLEKLPQKMACTNEKE